MSIQFGYSILYVQDVDATMAFYEKAFGLTRRFLKDGEYGELNTGSTTLAFAAELFVKGLVDAPFASANLDAPAPPVEIGLVTDDVDAAFQLAIAAGAVEVKCPGKKPWGQTVGYVRDLNGFLVEICTPMLA